MKTELFDWLFGNEKEFDLAAVQQLIEEIKVFNAGAIDAYLTKHVDTVFEKWLEQQRGN